MAWAGLKNRYGHSAIGLSIVALILLEICVGILNAVFHVPVPISATHTAIAATLTGLLFFAAAEGNHNLVKA
jgi:heme A synthase